MGTPRQFLKVAFYKGWEWTEKGLAGLGVVLGRGAEFSLPQAPLKKLPLGGLLNQGPGLEEDIQSLKSLTGGPSTMHRCRSSRARWEQVKVLGVGVGELEAEEGEW